MYDRIENLTWDNVPGAVYRHTQGNEKQVETIRTGQTNGKHTRGRRKLPQTRGELDFKIKQEVTRQTKLNIT